jgi:hypothetical protein
MIAKLKRLLNGIEQAAALGSRCHSLERENAELKDRNVGLWNNYNKKAEKASALEKELDEIRVKVRIQTEADLVLTSLKIIQGAMRGEKKEELSGLAYMQEQQMARYQAMGGSPNYYGGSLGGLGGIAAALGLSR